MSSKITSKGQITVPKVVRETLAVQPGDRISFVIREDGTVTVEAESVAPESLRGAIKSGRRLRPSCAMSCGRGTSPSARWIN